jgi:hypothetical protein
MEPWIRKTRAVSKNSWILRGKALGLKGEPVTLNRSGWVQRMKWKEKEEHTGTKNIRPGTALVYDPPRENLP